MKKFAFLGMIMLVCAGFVSAQNWGWGNNSPQSVTGTLQLKDGTIAVVNNNTVYYVPMLERFIGFIDGLKEGGQINVEGYVYNNQPYNYLQPSKVTINGKTYDMPVNNLSMGQRNGYRQNNNYGRSGWCCW